VLAIATTSIAFLPHLEQRIRSASSLSVTFQSTQASQGLRLNLTARSANTHHAHEEVAEERRCVRETRVVAAS
jgi:hypothetical protein